MLQLKPRYVIAFEGSGVSERLVTEAKGRGLIVVDPLGPLGAPPGITPCPIDRLSGFVPSAPPAALSLQQPRVPASKRPVRCSG